MFLYKVYNDVMLRAGRESLVRVAEARFTRRSTQNEKKVRGILWIDLYEKYIAI
jgi:hypothetical protein